MAADLPVLLLATRSPAMAFRRRSVKGNRHPACSLTAAIDAIRLHSDHVADSNLQQ